MSNHIRELDITLYSKTLRFRFMGLIFTYMMLNLSIPIQHETSPHTYIPTVLFILIRQSSSDSISIIYNTLTAMKCNISMELEIGMHAYINITYIMMSAILTLIRLH